MAEAVTNGTVRYGRGGWHRKEARTNRQTPRAGSSQRAESATGGEAAALAQDIYATHQRLLREYLAAWGEALQVRSRQEARWRPRHTYLGGLPRLAGMLTGFATTGWRWFWREPSGPAEQEEYWLRTYQGPLAGHAASLVRRFVGAHIAVRLTSLSKAYVQLARSPDVPESDRSRFEKMSKECAELATTFPTWRDSAQGAVPLLGLALGPTVAVLAIDGAWQILLSIVVTTYVFAVGLLISFFESFRLKRELLFPGARQCELHPDAAQPDRNGRNAYRTETRLHRALDWPWRREPPIDYALGFLLGASVSPFLVAPIVRALPSARAELLVGIVPGVVLLLGYISINWFPRKRLWR